MVMSVPVFHTSTRMLRRSLTVATSSAKTLFELAASEPKYGVGARFFRKNWVKNDYAPEQHAVHNVDLMFWAICAGSLDLATEVLWRRCRSPLRAGPCSQSRLLGFCQSVGAAEGLPAGKTFQLCQSRSMLQWCR